VIEKAMFDVAKIVAVATSLIALAVLGGGGWSPTPSEHATTFERPLVPGTATVGRCQIPGSHRR
jgi:hypothetical protein